MNLDTGIGLASLYLAIVSLLITLFSFQLSQWLSGILANEAKWKLIRNKTPKSDYFDLTLACYYDAKQSNSKLIILGWLIVTLFILVSFWFLINLIWNIDDLTNRMYVEYYIMMPMIIFFILYLFASITMMKIGFQRSKLVLLKSEEALKA